MDLRHTTPFTYIHQINERKRACLIFSVFGIELIDEIVWIIETTTWTTLFVYFKLIFLSNQKLSIILIEKKILVHKISNA